VALVNWWGNEFFLAPARQREGSRAISQKMGGTFPHFFLQFFFIIIFFISLLKI
jgi:hypothetical protein